MSILIIFFLYMIFSSSTVCNAETSIPSKDNPFTAKASLIRYWNSRIYAKNNLPKHPPPTFLLSKTSPLTAADSSILTKLATQNALSGHLDYFCSSANLYCRFDDSSSSPDVTSFSEKTNSGDHDDKNGNGAREMIKYNRDGANVGNDVFQSKIAAQKAYQSRYEIDKFSMVKHKRDGDDIFQSKIGSQKAYQSGYNIDKFSTESHNGSLVNKRIELGNFFRESVMKEGNVMMMPDIRDILPERSFLPRSISSKIPFSTSKLADLKDIFHARENSSMERVIINALTDCERAPNRGETKRCVGSIEDMLDFAISLVGHNILVRTTQNANGSKKNVMIGKVKGINGGKVTTSVTCHQSMYPYLVYYCHSVPKVRVYEVDILDVESKVKMNHGVAICHVDTSAWSQGHEAFVELGSSPGLIEVCHWIFENDMAWAIVD